MSVYMLPALIGLVLKLFILVLAFRGGKISTLFLSLIVVFACHNAIELVGYLQFSNNESVEMLFRPYYVVSIYSVMYILLHGLAISEQSNRVITAFLVSLATSISVLVLNTDLIVAGQYSIGYSITAVQGPFYWGFVLYVAFIFAATVAVLIREYRNAQSSLKSIRSAYSLFALAPVMVIALIAVLLKVTNTGINAAGIFPIATTVFLILILKGESQHRLMDIRRFLPFSPERKAATEVVQIMDEYTASDNSGSESFKALRNDIERKIIVYTLNRCNNNITKATKMMGFESRSTLYSMMNRLGINHNQGLQE